MSLKLNDYVHSNSESSMLIKNKITSVLCDIKETLINLEQLFLITLFFVDSTLFASEDYGDYVENYMIPPEGSQYWVNGYILDIFENIKSEDIDLFNFLRSHNKYSMLIDLE